MLDILEKIKLSIKRRQAKKQAKVRQEFLPEALEIVEKPISPTGRLLVLTLAVIVGFFLCWSVLGKMDEVVTARGMVITVSGIQEIQSSNGGVIEEIFVQEGSVVKAGEAIAQIDSSINEITLSNTTESLKLLEYENELLNIISKGNDIMQENIPKSGSGEEEIFNYVKSMQENYLAEKLELESNVKQMSEQVEIEKEILDQMAKNNEYLKEQETELDSVLQYSNTEEKTKEKIAIEIANKQSQLKDYKKLYKAGALPKVEVENLEVEIAQLQKDYEIQNSKTVYEDYENKMNQYELENQLIMAEKDYINQESAVTIAQTQYEQARDSLNTLELEFQANVTSLIVQNTENINTQKSNKEIQKIGVEEQTLVSPVDGVVGTLEVDTIGGVIASTQTIATIVPDDSQMVVEINIQNRDIGYIQNGQEVVIKLDTFNFQEYGKLEGTVAYISPDAVWSDNIGWIYKAKIAINEDEFKQMNPQVEIGVGMECTAEVKIGERKIIDFFLEPLVEHFDGSLKVR